MTMPSRSTRIVLLLCIDVCFFFTELVVGYAVGSLALVADSFHMLNDVLSLAVALYAIRLTSNNHSPDSRYTYGWHRAEILAALINGVFLLALCFSISLEALGRFFSTPDISNPKLIVIVGSLGLASNIFGLFLFHEHGHSDHSHSHTALASPRISESGLISGDTTPKPQKSKPLPMKRRESDDDHDTLYGHPAATRASLVQAAHALAQSPSPERYGDDERSPLSDGSRSSLSFSRSRHATEDSPLLSNTSNMAYVNTSEHILGEHEHVNKYNGNGGGVGHSHSHGSMNMRALVLHVIGDALGNLGVIGTGLVIWLTDWKYKYYFDPVISLVLAVIIFSSALPLVRSASFILLQGVPSNISLDSVRQSILDVDGVLSIHELHIWQLSENKVVASVHVTTSRDHDFMSVAANIRKELHEHGVHSCTIQPEYHHRPELVDQQTSCLISCPPNPECSPEENACCPPRPTEA